IGILIALLLPAIQAAREAARRTTCGNHLKQIGLALLNYEVAHRRLPVGARTQGSGVPPLGISWWVSILPHLEQNALYQRYDFQGAANGSAIFNIHTANLVNRVTFEVMACPSSSLPWLHTMSHGTQ